MTDKQINEVIKHKLGTSYRPHRRIQLSEREDSEMYVGVGAMMISRIIQTDEIPDYCNSIEAAWQIVEYLQKKEYAVEVTGSGIDKDFYFECWIIRPVERPYSECAGTAPRAICMAFLKLGSDGRVE